MAAVTSDNVMKVVINITGARSGRQWTGEFAVKKRLSMADYCAMDRYRREILGPVAPEYAEPRARSIAETLGEMSVRIVAEKDTPIPTWWVESRGGLDLEDDEPIKALDEAIQAQLKADAEARAKKVEAARAEMKAASETDKPA